MITAQIIPTDKDSIVCVGRLRCRGRERNEMPPPVDIIQLWFGRQESCIMKPGIIMNSTGSAKTHFSHISHTLIFICPAVNIHQRVFAIKAI